VSEVGAGGGHFNIHNAPTHKLTAFKETVLPQKLEFTPSTLCTCGQLAKAHSIKSILWTQTYKRSQKQLPKSRKRFRLSAATCHKNRSTRLWKTYQT